MEIAQGTSISPATLCEWCLNIGTSRCGRCHSVYYCSRQHQVEHWSIHKKVCKKNSSMNVQSPVLLNTGADALENFNYGDWCQNNLSDKPGSMNALPQQSNFYDTNNYAPDSEKHMDFQIPSEEEIFSSLSSELLSSDNNFWDIINSVDAQSLFDCGTISEKDRAIAKISASLQEGAPIGSIAAPKLGVADADMDLMQCASLHDICSNVVHDLNAYGICVLDKFIGSNNGILILNEVKNLYHKGIFKKGELVNQSPYLPKESVRCDVTTWVDGTEPDCVNIGGLIKKLDVVVTACNKLKDSRLLSKYKLNRRTKAMIACYPGDGTYYKKHVDNPHKDGRCITCIYYLNQNWDIKQHGGLLRMFPSAHDSQVANIEPIFDRILFFWSDKRNPHEVLPAFATRFAITVWYFDADERDGALLQSRNRVMKSRDQQYMNYAT